MEPINETRERDDGRLTLSAGKEKAAVRLLLCVEEPQVGPDRG